MNTDRAEKWKEALGILDIQNEISGMVCLEHFNESDFRRKNKTELKANVIPRSYKSYTQDTQVNISVEIETNDNTIDDAMGAALEMISQNSMTDSIVQKMINLEFLVFLYLL